LSPCSKLCFPKHKSDFLIMKTRSSVPLVGVCVLVSSFSGARGQSPFNVLFDAVDNVMKIFTGSSSKPDTTRASCKASTFSCIGPDRDYCKKQEKLCFGAKKGEETCHPLCHWSCTDMKCEQACAPKCNPPTCQTRCKGFNTQSCHMKCAKPSCAIICPKTACHSDGCVKCSTQCSQPTCHLECGNDLQNCKNVCAEPLCTWECNKNSSACPKPKCEMKCEEPKNCLASSVHRELPPMQKGETQVVNFEASANASKLLQVSQASTSMTVKLATLDENNKVQMRQVELPVAKDQPAAATDDSDQWASTITNLVSGKPVTSEASCKAGQFSCSGDHEWCAQQSSECGGRRSFTQLRSRTQHHLKP